MARVIAISNHKGGVGKTTLAANLGFVLARHFKVLLIDLDPQSNLSTGLGFQNKPENIAKYFKEVIHFRLPQLKPYSIFTYVDIIPGHIDLYKIENQLHEAIRSEYILKEILVPLQTQYDLILVDCPPSFSILTQNALNACNLILIPAKPEIFSINGIDLIMNYAEQNALPVKIAFNQVNSRSNLHKSTLTEAKSHYNGKMLNHTIRNTVVLAEAFENAKNIFLYRSTSKGAEDFLSLSDELLPYL